jgi:hypothetical protein
VKRAAAGILAAAALCALLAACATTAPSPVSLTAAQRKAATEADLDIRWAQVAPGNPNYLRPTVPIIRYVNYLEEGPVLTRCMHEAGYPHVAWTLKGGLVDTDVKPVDRFPVEVAIYTCEAQYPEDPQELGYLSAAQGKYLYAYWSDETVPCLRAHGAVVGELPKAGGASGVEYSQIAPFNPFNNAKLPHGTSQAYLLTACPPYPSALYAKDR